MKLILWISTISVIFEAGWMQSCRTFLFSWHGRPQDAVLPPEAVGEYTSISEVFCKQRPLYVHTSDEWNILFTHNTTWDSFPQQWAFVDRKHCSASIGVLHGTDQTAQVPYQEDTWRYRNTDGIYSVTDIILTCIDPEATTTTTATSTTTTTTSSTSASTSSPTPVTTSTLHSSTANPPGADIPGGSSSDAASIDLIPIIAGAVAGNVVVLIIIVVIVVCCCRRRQPESSSDDDIKRKKHTPQRRRMNTYVTGDATHVTKKKNENEKEEKTEEVYEEITMDNGEYLTVAMEAGRKDRPVTGLDPFPGQRFPDSEEMHSRNPNQQRKPKGLSEPAIMHHQGPRYPDDRRHGRGHVDHTTGVHHGHDNKGFMPTKHEVLMGHAHMNKPRLREEIPTMHGQRYVQNDGNSSQMYISSSSHSVSTGFSASSDKVLLPIPPEDKKHKAHKGKRQEKDDTYLKPVN